MVLVVEPEHLITQILNDLGHQTIRLRYKERTKGPGRRVPAQIRKGEITGICVLYQRRSTKDSPEEKIHKFNRELNIGVTHALELGLDVRIIGLTGSSQENDINNFTSGANYVQIKPLNIISLKKLLLK
jgi:hypothetical protein